MEEAQWHYKDERNGTRVGPVSRSEVEKLIAEAQIARVTLVWNPTMQQWAAASSTDLSSMFGNEPPPLPASEISRWAVYALALFPIWGTFIQAVASVPIAAHKGLEPQAVFEHRAWFLMFCIGAAALAELDERNLERAGLKIRGAAVVAAFLAPIYIFASCRAFKRHAGRAAWLAYAPLPLWLAAMVGAAVVSSALFDPDAPLILRPDAWF